MRVKEKWRIEQFMRSAKATQQSPTMIVSLPVAMANLNQYPGADRHTLAGVWCQDGKAIVRPASLRCGILVVDWSLFMRYLRRREGDRWPFDVGDSFDLHSCQVNGCYFWRGAWSPHSARPGRYRVLEKNGNEVILGITTKRRSIDQFRCGVHSLRAIIGEPWSNYAKAEYATFETPNRHQPKGTT